MYLFRIVCIVMAPFIALYLGLYLTMTDYVVAGRIILAAGTLGVAGLIAVYLMLRKFKM